MKRLLLGIVVMVLVWGTGASLPAQSPEKSDRLLTIETFFDMESAGSPNISPDGQQILFTRSWVDKLNDQQVSNVWLTDVEGKRVRLLTSGNWRDSSPVWSPDGKRLAFLSDRDGTTQLYVMWLDTREVAPLTHLERPPSGLAWSPDGKKIAFTAFLPDEKPILQVKLPKKPEGAKWAAPAILIDRLSWRSDGRGPLPKGYSHIFVVDAALGGTPCQVTSGDYSHGEPEWSSDGKTLFFSAVRKPEAEYEFRNTEIYALDLASLEINALTDRKGPDANPVASPDGRWVAYTGYDDRNYTYHLSSLYVMAPDGGRKQLLAANLPDSPANLAWSVDGRGVYCTLNEKGSTNLHYIPLSGPGRKVTDGVHVLAAVSLSPAGQGAAVLSDFTRPSQLVTFSLQRPGELRRLVDVNADILEGVKLGQAEELRFKAPDGLNVQGWLIRPAEFDAAKKYPLVLWIHGGPWSMYSVAFSWAWQNFAAEGYAVLFLNPRGSTGYGQDFVNGIQYSYPGKDYDDLMAGVDAALAKGFIDPQNLFVCGGSGGGVLTAWIVGHTDRFRAAVSMRPVIDWMSFCGTTDGADWYKQFKSYPWEDPVEYALRSPLHYVAKVKTPTMVMTGEADLRTPMGQSEEYYRALKMLKKETLLVRMPEEYHGWRRPSHQLLQQLYLKAWFEKYRAKPEEVKEEKGQ